MDELIRDILGWYRLLTQEDKAACDEALRRGYLVWPRHATPLLSLVYGLASVLNRQPVVDVMPTRQGKWRLLVTLPSPDAFPPIAQLVVEAQIGILYLCRRHRGIVGFVEAERSEPVAQLLSKKARRLCAVYRREIIPIPDSP